MSEMNPLMSMQSGNTKKEGAVVINRNLDY